MPTSIKISDHLVPIILILLTGLVMVVPDALYEALRYNRDSIDDFQWWRFLTANFVHSNGIHWLANCIGLVLIWRLFYDSLTTTQWLFIFALAFIINVLLIHFFTPRIRWYVGMSGSLHAIICIGIIIRNQLYGWAKAAVLVGVIAKVVWENWFQTDNTMAELINVRVATEAHLHGVSSGIILGVILRLLQEKAGLLRTAPAAKE